MTRSLLAFLTFGLFVLAVLGAFAQAVGGKRPALFGRREIALP
ncbi:MAG TPA: hypothetical protein VK488_10765 [Gaiellaceae bacterium]|nr:hypothetical protein [Gaiellaceae bacterium]